MEDKDAYKNRDRQWRELGRRLREAAKRSDWQQMESIYREQATFLRREKRDSFQVSYQAMRCNLMHAKSQGVTGVRISTSRDDRTCEKCRALEGMAFTIDEAIGKMPLPVKCNEEDWCRCVYAYEMK